MLVVVGSRNPAKVKGTALAFRSAFKGVRVRGMDAPSKVGSQPLGWDRTLLGATNRAQTAIQKTGADFGVGIEAGIVSLDDEHVNLQLAVVIDRKGRYSIGSSAGFMIPGRFAKEMHSGGLELEHFAKELTGAEKILEQHGVVYHLTKRKVSRVDMTEQCVTMALVPWLNARVYWPQRKPRNVTK